jgi:hypothetical protein
MNRKQSVLRHRIKGVSLLEVLIVVAVLSMLIGLLLPAVQSARETARRMNCTNNMRQLCIAVHIVHDMRRGLPPLCAPCSDPGVPGCLTPNIAGYGSQVYTLFGFVLPEIDQRVVFEKMSPTELMGGQPWAVIPTFLCPSDPSVENGKPVTRWNSVNHLGASCYAVNNYVFGSPPAKVTFNRSRLPGAIPDGTSNTIFFAEKFATCSRTGSLSGTSGPPGAVSASLWASSTDIWRPGFNLGSFKAGDAVEGYPLSPFFQYLPNFVKQCDLERVQTAHIAGIVVSLGDGSTRSFSPTMEQRLWGLLNDPRDGAIIVAD